MIQLGFDGSQTRLDVANAFANGQLSEREAEELIPKGEIARTTIASMQPHARVEKTTVRATCCVKFSRRQPDG